MEPQSVVDQSSISPIVPTTKPKNRIVLLIGGIIILCAGIGIGLFFGKNLSPTSQVSTAPTPLPAEASAKEGDPTANWKTFTNAKYGFSFNHPNLDDTCCRLAGAISDNPVHIVTLADKSTVRPNSDAPFDGLAVHIVPNKNGLTLAQYIEKEKAALISDFESMADPGQINQGVTTRTSINGLPAMVLSNYSWDGITRTYFKSNNNSFIFEISKKEQSLNHFVQYDQILSTFKFVEQFTDISNWKTYTNNKCKYQISYPESWMLFPEPENGIYGAVILVSYGDEKKPNDNNWLKVQIGCGVVSAGDSQRQTVDKLNARDSGYGVPKVESLGQTTLNGKLAYKQITTAQVGDPILEYYIFADDTSFVNIGFTPSTSKLSAEIQKIVSSFKFIK